MGNPNYSEISLANTLDLLKLCLECEEFPEYSENSCKNVAELPEYQKILPNILIFRNIFTEYPNFLGFSTTCNVVLQIFVECPNYSGSSH